MSWRKEEIQYLKDNAGKQSFKTIATHLGKSEMAVQLYVHRYRIPVAEQKGRNLVQEILTIKFVNPEYFTPTKAFYKAIGMNQKRWWNLYFGKERMTEDEYFRLIEHFQVTLREAFDARQLKLFEDND
jgi:hypothetical protein|nr:MAG TPA: dormancy survival regulator-like protein [Caudoviricetes sp.]